MFITYSLWFMFYSCVILYFLLTRNKCFWRYDYIQTHYTKEYIACLNDKSGQLCHGIDTMYFYFPRVNTQSDAGLNLYMW